MKQFLFGLLAAAAMDGAVLADVKTDGSGAVLVEGKADTEAKKLEGVWDLEAIEILGKNVAACTLKGGSFVFSRDGKVIMQDPGKKDQAGAYKIDTNKNPKTLDLIELKDGKAGKVMEMICEIDGDRLKLGCSVEGPTGKRPRDFKDDKVLVMRLKRRKS